MSDWFPLYNYDPNRVSETSEREAAIRKADELLTRMGALDQARAVRDLEAELAAAREQIREEQEIRQRGQDIYEAELTAAREREERLREALRSIVDRAYPKEAWFVNIARAALSEGEG